MFALGQRSELFWSIMRAELRIAGSRMGEEAMAKVSGWRDDWRVERRVEVRVQRFFSSCALDR